MSRLPMPATAHYEAWRQRWLAGDGQARSLQLLRQQGLYSALLVKAKLSSAAVTEVPSPPPQLAPCWMDAAVTAELSYHIQRLCRLGV